MPTSHGVINLRVFTPVALIACGMSVSGFPPIRELASLRDTISWLLQIARGAPLPWVHYCKLNGMSNS
ncbi:hypothetical protein ASPVEDRAFT_44742 [Aspergillus versicolor CBS 583.65]|uniref:Uncharacterized protein n=1 Tax=Aspergillus versicolor CBS 583.65 TaxID=1036611 RepID=A0A1L9PUV5_ASPVE|nr:uncharacterized protein ASPVEDRAFT_44742 [Aspergillus versicolor CBS 583.65]OJJ05215.1 hypothetical protein ASPVEDRAFT_44742 [Aspergillus versicolor CBS 583.65]